MTSPSLKEFEFNTSNSSDALLIGRMRLPLANLMLFATCGCPSSIETLASVPLCQSTALTFCNVLRINDRLRNLSIDFPFERSNQRSDLDQEDDSDNDSNDSNDDNQDEMDEEDDENFGAMNDLRVVHSSLAPEVAQALSVSTVQSLGLNWLEHFNFAIGQAFIAALPGCLPSSLRQLEINNFNNCNAIARAISLE